MEPVELRRPSFSFAGASLTRPQCCIICGIFIAMLTCVKRLSRRCLWWSKRTLAMALSTFGVLKSSNFLQRKIESLKNLHVVDLFRRKLEKTWQALILCLYSLLLLVVNSSIYEFCLGRVNWLGLTLKYHFSKCLIHIKAICQIN